MIPNSMEWWNDQFESKWDRVEGINGPAQTRYFMELIVKYCGLDLTGSILDFGCAMGQGVEVLSRHSDKVEGYDFSPVGIVESRKRVNGVFMSELPSKTYDVVVCSNVLEHFADPIPVFKQLLNLSNKYVVIMTPYNQTPTCEVHPITVTETTFPKVEGFKKTIKHIPNEKPEMGGMNQIMFIYEREIV